MKYVYFLFIVTILFIMYTEFSVGNIIWRESAKGIKIFRPTNIIHYLMNPLYNGFLLNYQLLDVNYIFFIFISTVFYHNIN